MQTIESIIEKEELKVDALMKSLAENVTSLAVEDSVDNILQQEYLPLVNAICDMAKRLNVDVYYCYDIIAVVSHLTYAVDFVAKTKKKSNKPLRKAIKRIIRQGHDYICEEAISRGHLEIALNVMYNGKINGADLIEALRELGYQEWGAILTKVAGDSEPPRSNIWTKGSLTSGEIRELWGIKEPPIFSDE